MSDRFNTALEPLWVFLEKGMIVRRGVLFVAIWMTLDSYAWAKIYAYNPNPDPLIYAARPVDLCCSAGCAVGVAGRCAEIL